MSQPLPRSVWLAALTTFGVLFALLTLNAFVGAWPSPWILVELILGATAIFGMLLSLLAIVYRHPLAPRPPDRPGTSLRFWLLFVAMLAAPVGLLLLPAEWSTSHALALVWGVAGLAAGAVAFFAGRPWPVSK
ncbi:MAG: hypothetical protein E6I73_04150 [Chloroflexi bacterium]|nr:MAG: hypothetical protein E6I73_04150 [Chloroflexota bacterium]